jgi:argininosuccinate lyase
MASEKSWQSRIGGEIDKLAAEFVESISYDRRLYKQDIAGSIAHATMLAKVGLITDQEREQIVQGLKGIERDIEAGKFEFDQSLEDIHMVIEDALIKRIGEPGKKLHTGRSRNDQVALDLSLFIVDAINNLVGPGAREGDADQAQANGLLDHLVKSFVLLADKSRNVVMPAFTHLQRAQPISAGAEALAWATFFDLDASALNCFRAAGISTPWPLGSGAIAGTSLPIHRGMSRWVFGNPEQYVDEKAIADAGAFSLKMVIETEKIQREIHGVRADWYSSIHNTASRDDALEFLFRLAVIAMHLSRWAEQWIIYSTTEFGVIRIADKYTTGSSMMPQKRNPDMLELIRGRCGNVYGDLFALMTILKGLPIGYNRDLQEDKRIVFRAYDTVLSCLTMAAAIVNSAEFIRENIEPTLERGFLDATSLAEYFVTKGVPFRTAHQIVGSLVAKCEKEGKNALSQLSLEDFKKACDKTEKDVYEALGAKNVVKRYKSAGAAGGKPFEEQLAAWKKRLGM